MSILSALITLLLAAQAYGNTCSKAGEYFDSGQQMCLRCPLPSSEIQVHLHYLSTCRNHPVCCVANSTGKPRGAPDEWRPDATASSPAQAAGESTVWIVIGALVLAGLLTVQILALILVYVKFVRARQGERQAEKGSSASVPPDVNTDEAASPCDEERRSFLHTSCHGNQHDAAAGQSAGTDSPASQQTGEREFASASQPANHHGNEQRANTVMNSIVYQKNGRFGSAIVEAAR
ncbi:hypothetical protein BOX15_Mlig007536g1 [Macrostomum lignano]|uniref:TNFR-Cys domain-containing protein n=1 Tax=Macrostomum lignano TaxID=282301 RepID=A0A267EV69_9PLAT|nr:hypothetical protein BOX15_Mlig031201g1 [Macrostomum lignano]PAA86519.1 hypothetical protein BOX15_Mlig007536g1 [Macrostomum lignano]